ncbi:MAG: hypothetical protein QGH50_23185, partial [SAR324 cluster bacterium]|nr:hypothetical protein [SAR324 cluster bacterium]
AFNWKVKYCELPVTGNFPHAKILCLLPGSEPTPGSFTSPLVGSSKKPPRHIYPSRHDPVLLLSDFIVEIFIEQGVLSYFVLLFENGLIRR